MYLVNQQTLSERNKRNTNSPIWDKILLGIFWLLSFFIIYLVAGIEASATSKPLNLPFVFSMILYVLSGVISLWALVTNVFLESTVRIQADRNQKVCKSGPYKIVRHPTYTAIIIWYLSISLF